MILGLLPVSRLKLGNRQKRRLRPVIVNAHEPAAGQ